MTWCSARMIAAPSAVTLGAPSARRDTPSGCCARALASQLAYGPASAAPPSSARARKVRRFEARRPPRSPFILPPSSFARSAPGCDVVLALLDVLVDALLAFVRFRLPDVLVLDQVLLLPHVGGVAH